MIVRDSIAIAILPTQIPDPVIIEILLCRVGKGRAVVVDIEHSIAVVIVVTLITETVAVCIGLTGIPAQRTNIVFVINTVLIII